MMEDCTAQHTGYSRKNSVFQQRAEISPVRGKLGKDLAAAGSAVKIEGQCQMRGIRQNLVVAGKQIVVQSGRSTLFQASPLCGGMQIFIKAITSNRFSLDAASSDLVSDIKHKITAKTGIPMPQQRLIFSNTELEDSLTLSYYSIEKEATLYLMIDWGKCVISVVVKTLSGKKVVVSVEKTSLVETLKAQIRDIEGIQVENQALIFAGRRLRDGRNLTDYNVQREATIYLVITDNTVIQILVKVEEARETLTLDVRKSDSIDAVKEQIKEKKGIEKDAQVLLFRGQKLDDRSALGECGIEQEALVLLQWSKTGETRSFRTPKETTQKVH